MHDCNFKKYWRHSGVTIVNFEKIPHLFLVFHSWISGTVASWVSQQRSKYRQVKTIKHARTDTNYAILTKLVKLQDEKKPVSNLLSMQSTGFQQTFMKFLDSRCVMSWTVTKKYIYEIYKGREMHRHYLRSSWPFIVYLLLLKIQIYNEDRYEDIF